MKILTLFLSCTISCFMLQAQVQIPTHIAQRLQGDSSFKGFAFYMSRYLDSLLASTNDSSQIKAINKRYKKLARHLHYLEGHQDGRGNIINSSLKNFEAIAQLESDGFNNPESVNGNWTRVGPDLVTTTWGIKGIGRADRIAFHPTVSTTIYAGTPSGGLFKTTNDGLVWSNINNYIPSLGISGLVVSHASPTTLYVLTGDGDSNLGSWPSGCSGWGVTSTTSSTSTAVRAVSVAA